MRRLLLPALVLLTVALPASADVIVTTEGLRLEGEVSRDATGRFIVVTETGKTVLEAEGVASFRRGESRREILAKKADALTQDDGVAWYALGLEAEAEGARALARRAFEQVVQITPDHEAARRALGQERVDGAWVDVAVARRRRGLILFDGRWLLPAEVEVVARERVSVPTHDVRALVRSAAGDDPVLARAAHLALAETSDRELVETARTTLLDADPAVRKVSARLLGEVGDEAGLRPLIFSAARDLDASVRGESLRAAMTFGHDDLAMPFVRALGSTNPRLVGHAAQALGAIGDQRAIGYVVKRLTSHGSSTRNFVSFMNQISYVRDYDVEIAQASNIANPDVGTILEGVVLDVRVLDAAYSRTWVEPLLVGAVSQLAGRPFRNREEVLAWYAKARKDLPAFASTQPRRLRAPPRPRPS